jgi:hypothetical protein
MVPLSDLKSLTEGSTSIIRGPFTDNVVVELHYTDQTLSRNNAASSGLSWRYKMNSPYDPDPFLSSGAVSGFAEWAAIYSTYRCIGFRYSITVMNQETFPVVITCCPTSADLGSNSIYAPELGEALYGKQTQLSGKGGMDKGHLQGNIYLPHFYGPSYLWEQNFDSAVTGNPPVVLYFNIGAFAPVAFVSGLIVSVKLTFITSFYKRQNVFS